jgi:hypothetical protein
MIVASIAGLQHYGQADADKSALARTDANGNYAYA